MAMYTVLLGLLIPSITLGDNLVETVTAFDIKSTVIVEEPPVKNLRTYVRINSAHPNPDYDSCVSWLRNQSEEIGMDFHLKQFEKPDLFAVWLTWNGTNPSLKSILLNSHMDVVAVDVSKWEHDPFEAFKDEEGNIFGRGTIDMKSATVGILEAIRRLKTSDFQPLRTIHVSIMPDEEVGGHRGMEAFTRSTHFQDMNVGLDIDESFPSINENMVIPYGEKSIWQFNVTALGKAAHGASLPASDKTAWQKLQNVINKLMQFRESQLLRLKESNLTLQNLTTINLVRLGGGIGNNIIPDELWASFDMRIRLQPDWNFTDVEAMLNTITQEAGGNVSYKWIQKSMESGQTSVDGSSVWWRALEKTCGQLNVTCQPKIISGATDGRYVRAKGIPVFGINPFLNTIKMAHQDNERINEKNFLEGIDRYAMFIRNFASVSEQAHP